MKDLDKKYPKTWKVLQEWFTAVYKGFYLDPLGIYVACDSGETYLADEMTFGVFLRFFDENEIHISVAGEYWKYLIEWQDGYGSKGWSEHFTDHSDKRIEALTAALEKAFEVIDKREFS